MDWMDETDDQTSGRSDGVVELTRAEVVRAIESHRAIGDPDGAGRPMLRLTVLARALDEVKRSFPDYRHRTGGILLRSLVVYDDVRRDAPSLRIEAPVSIRFHDCRFEVEDTFVPFRLADLSVNSLAIVSSEFTGAVEIERVTVQENFDIETVGFHDSITMRRIRVFGDLRIEGLTERRTAEERDFFSTPGPKTIQFDDCRVGGALFLSRLTDISHIELSHSAIVDEIRLDDLRTQVLRIADLRAEDDLRITGVAVLERFELRSSFIRGDIEWRPIESPPSDEASNEDDDEGDQRVAAHSSAPWGMSVARILICDVAARGGLRLKGISCPQPETVSRRAPDEAGLRIDRCTFAGNSAFTRVEVPEGVSIRNSRFEGLLELKGTTFGPDRALGTAKDAGDVSEGRPLGICLEIIGSEFVAGLDFSTEAGRSEGRCRFTEPLLLRGSKFGRIEFASSEFKSGYDDPTSPGFQRSRIDVLQCRIAGSLVFSAGMIIQPKLVFTSSEITGSVEILGVGMGYMEWKDSVIGGAFALVEGSVINLVFDGTRCEELRLFSKDDDEKRKDIATKSAPTPHAGRQSIDRLVLGDTHVGRLAGDLSKWCADPNEAARTGRSGRRGRRAEQEAPPRVTRFEARAFTFDRLDAEAYGSLTSAGMRGGLKWLEAAKDEAGGTSQPSRSSSDARLWTQLSAVFRRMGDEDRADDLLIDARKRKRAGQGWGEWAVDLFLEWTSAYGYKPLRTALICVGVIVICGCIAYRLGLSDEVEVVDGEGTIIEACTMPVLMTRRVPGDYELATGDNDVSDAVESAAMVYKAASYPALSSVLYHLDTFFPLLDLDMHSSWIANAGVRWHGPTETYVLPARPFPRACMKPKATVKPEERKIAPEAAGPGADAAVITAPPKPDATMERHVRVRLANGTFAKVKWLSDPDLPPSAEMRSTGSWLFSLFVVERIVGGLMTALLIVGLTGILRKSGE